MRMVPQFSKAELEINDRVIRMFTEPMLELDTDMLRAYADKLHAEKMALMMQANAQREDLMSNAKFAIMLQELGIDPPMKVSPTWAKKPPEERKGDGMTYAFAKTDPGMQALAEHPDERVQILIAARLQNKTTIAEKGAERLISMASRGPATVYMKYSGASGTHRLSGGDKFNWQSMKRGSDLRNATMAPEGQMVVVGDSSNIEARVLDWLAGQDDMVQVYIDADNKVGPDIYCVIAGRIYKRDVTKADIQERQMGKVAKLGLGFGMGGDKFVSAVRGQAKDADGKPLIITRQFSQTVVDIYRDAHPQVRKLWKRGEDALKCIANGKIGMDVDYQGVVKTCKDGLIMPGGLRILFPDLKFIKGEGPFGGEWSFWNGKMREHIYGAKLVENCIAEGTLVLTDSGWLPIEQVSVYDLVHDGIDFVSHGGTIFKSVQQCISIDGVWMTPDHEVLTNEGWQTASQNPEPYRPDIRCAYSHSANGQRWEKAELGVSVSMRENNYTHWLRSDAGGEARGDTKLRMPAWTINIPQVDAARNVQTPSICGVAGDVRSMWITLPQGLQKLWRSRSNSMRALGRVIREFLGRYGANLYQRVNPGKNEQRQRVLAGELQMGYAYGASKQSSHQLAFGYTAPSSVDRNSKVNIVLPGPSGAPAFRVYDIMNAGPRQRFVVLGKEEPFVVHNCVQCLARIIVFDQCLITSKELTGIAKWVHSVHDEGVFVTHAFYAPYARDKLLGNMRIPPAWCPDLPLNSEGGFHQRYGKAKS